jgi:hypothetical protein
MTRMLPLPLRQIDKWNNSSGGISTCTTPGVEEGVHERLLASSFLREQMQAERSGPGRHVCHFHFRLWCGLRAPSHQSAQDSGYHLSLSPTRQLSTFNGKPTNHRSETAMSESGMDRLARALGLGSGSRHAADKSSSRPFKKKDVPSLAQYIQSDACRKIHLMVSLVLNLAMCDFFEPDFSTKAGCRCGIRRRHWPVIGL